MAFPFQRHHGILGINARNLLFVRPFNPQRAVAFADDKLKTKVFLETRGIPVPRLYGKIPDRDALRDFNFSELPESFVLKPNHGYGGEGIIIVEQREQDGFRTTTGEHVPLAVLLEHIEDILDGMYSLNHRVDSAFFEQIIIANHCFDPLSPAGLPDIRIIVHNLIPVMAMMRLPTAESSGKANVHQGGIGLGIDLAKGVTTFAVQHDRLIEQLPNGRDFSGFRIPYWDDLLLIASRIQQITNIGFIGVDLTIAEEHGPILLEVNARPGLMVQIANLAPLGRRLNRVAGLKVSSPEKGVRIAQDLFGEKVLVRRPSQEAKPVVGTVEYIEILGGKKAINVPVILRPEYDRTVFDPTLVDELREIDAIEEGEDGTLRVKFMLGGKKVQTVVQPHHIVEEGVRGSLGKRDLIGFLVDPAKLPPSPHVFSNLNTERIDHQIADIDRKLQILKHLQPVNLALERARAEENPRYNPVFVYPESLFDQHELLDRLQYLEGDTSPMGILLEKKRQEIIGKIALIESRGQNEAFTNASMALFPLPDAAQVQDALEVVRQWKGPEESLFDGESLSAEDVRGVFNDVLSQYGLRDWRVMIKKEAIVDCAIGRNSILLRADARFTRGRVDGLVAHEIETHVLTSENGAKQPYELFERGMAGYLETQEGMAMERESRVIESSHEKRSWPALGMLAVEFGLTHSFADLRAYIRDLGFDDLRALRTCFTVKRGMRNTAQHGAFTKGSVYFRGIRLIQAFLQGEGNMHELYKGKINLHDLFIVRQVPNLIDPVYIPRDLQAAGGAPERKRPGE